MKHNKNRPSHFILPLTTIVMLWMTYGCTVQKGYPPQDRQPATYINTKNAHTTYKNSSKPKPEKGRPYNKAEQKTTHAAHDTNIVKEARKWIGTPYRYAGNNRSGTDCSGLTMELYRNVYGIKLPRSSAGQQEFCKHISRDQLEPGDLVFFATSGNRSRVSHVALYIRSGGSQYERRIFRAYISFCRKSSHCRLSCRQQYYAVYNIPHSESQGHIH